MEDRESMTSNTAIHLRRLPQAVFIAKRALRPGDGKRCMVAARLRTLF